jgi:hypothetical protein
MTHGDLAANATVAIGLSLKVRRTSMRMDDGGTITGTAAAPVRHTVRGIATTAVSSPTASLVGVARHADNNNASSTFWQNRRYVVGASGT